VSGANITVSNVDVTSATSLTADLVIGGTAALGARTVSVTTAGGTSGTQTFTINPPVPTLSSVSPNVGAQGGVRTVTLTGSGFIAGGTTVNVTGAGITVSNVNVSSSTSLTADFTTALGAAISTRSVSVTTAGGTSGTQNFDVIAGPSITLFNSLATHLAAAQPARLRWATSNAASCSIDNGVGAVSSCNDSLFVTPGSTKTYTLTATNAGATVTANFQIFANEPGRWVYSTSSGGAVGTHVHQYSINSATGNLSAIGTGNVTAGNSTQGLAVDPAGKYLYAVNAGASDNVSMYTIDPTTGALTANGTIAAGNDPIEIVVDPTGRFAYALNQSAGSISQYTIGSTGTLAANGSSTVGTQPHGITIDGTGRFLYAANRDDKTISEFAINSDGTLTLLGTLAVAGGVDSRPYLVTTDPTGRFLYVTHDSRGGYSQYSIGSNGTLTLITGPVILSTPPGTIRPVAVDPTNRFAYMVDFNNAIFHEFTVDQTTGALTRFAAPTLPHTLPTTHTTNHLAIDPQGKFAYAADGNNGQIIIFTIGSDGSLSPVTAPLTTIFGGTSPFGVVVSR
jgi:6-phosphogluconolactonase (cycloisomerase 2 family)